MFSPRSTPSPLRDELERAADLLVAFATLESITSVRELFGLDEPAPEIHPHRGPALRPRARRSRAGSVAPSPHVCATAGSRLRGRDGHRAAH